MTKYEKRSMMMDFVNSLGVGLTILIWAFGVWITLLLPIDPGLAFVFGIFVGAGFAAGFLKLGEELEWYEKLQRWVYNMYEDED